MKFEAKDFYVCDEMVDGKACTREHEISLSDKECADIANAKLSEWLAASPTVYRSTKNGYTSAWHDFNGAEKIADVQAKLVNIEPLEKK